MPNDFSKLNINKATLYIKFFATLISIDGKMSEYEIEHFKKLLDHFSISSDENEAENAKIISDYALSQTQQNLIIEEIKNELSFEEIVSLHQYLQIYIKECESGKAHIKERFLIDEIFKLVSSNERKEKTKKSIILYACFALLVLIAFIFTPKIGFNPPEKVKKILENSIEKLEVTELGVGEYFLQRIAIVSYEKDKPNLVKFITFGLLEGSSAELLYQGTVMVKYSVDLQSLEVDVDENKKVVYLEYDKPKSACSIIDDEKYTRQLDSKLNKEKPERLGKLESVIKSEFVKVGPKWIEELNLNESINDNCRAQIKILFLPFLPDGYEVNVSEKGKRIKEPKILKDGNKAL
jgi:hypothetical protein